MTPAEKVDAIFAEWAPLLDAATVGPWEAEDDGGDGCGVLRLGQDIVDFFYDDSSCDDAALIVALRNSAAAVMRLVGGLEGENEALRRDNMRLEAERDAAVAENGRLREALGDFDLAVAAHAARTNLGYDCGHPQCSICGAGA